MQIVGMLIASVIGGQILILLIVALLSPPRPSIYHLGEIAAALSGRPVRPQSGAPLVLSLGGRPPVWDDPSGAEFIFAERSQLARMLHVDVRRLMLGRDRPRVLDLGAPYPHAPISPQPPAYPDRFAFGHSVETDRVGDPLPRVDSHDVLFGRFEAALQLPSGDWRVVRPVEDPFPSPWQSRVIAWFLACLAVFGPASYLFARRLVRPITAFALAAERLGRDPTGELQLLRGPSEIGVAARAFNDMQARLKRYVEDRMAMIGAISHDLRTPLTRIRFKIETAPASVRDSVTADLDQMEAMIAAALAFVHDATRVPDREQLDLLSVLECVVDDARSAGADARLATNPPLVIDGDALALHRLFTNLVDNAIKYGGRADVRLFADAGDAVVEVADKGPGLPPQEMDRVFEPFYRGERSRNRDTGGIGLGLAVARSIARAHGGDVALRSTSEGLIASVRLPALMTSTAA